MQDEKLYGIGPCITQLPIIEAENKCKRDLITEMARMMAEQDAARRPAEQLREQAARQVDRLIEQGIYADPLVKREGPPHPNK